MSGDDIRTFFAENAPQIPRLTVRTENALIRGGIETMEQLCEKSDGELRKVRNLGEQCLELAVAMREKYKKEHCQGEYIVREELR